MSQFKILAFAGSTRAGSFNKKLVAQATELAREAGAQVKLIDLNDYPMPLYDGDDEAQGGLPEKAAELKREMQTADAFLIASPEYNSSISAVLKNTIDWTSRPGAVEGSVYAGKTAAIISASPGALGGMRGLNHLRAILMNLGVLVLTQQHAVSQAHNAFGEDGSFADGSNNEKIKAVVQELVRVGSSLRPQPV